MNSNKPTRINILGYPVDAISMESAFNNAVNYLKNKAHLHIVTLNPEMIVQAQKNRVLHDSITSAELIIPDGAGILLGLWLKGKFLLKAIPGIELSEKLLEYCSLNNHTIAMLGSTEETITHLITKLSDKYNSLNIVYTRNGYFSESEEAQIAKDISNLKPSIVFIALGVPKQEIWINRYRELFPNSLLIGVGGSFDVWSGRSKRAPKPFRFFKVEWLYRLIKEPFRAKRMFTSLPYFAWQLIASPEGKNEFTT